MSKRTLQDLLAAADADAGVPELPDGLAVRVGGLVRQRARRRVGLSIAAAAVIAIGGAATLYCLPPYSSRQAGVPAAAMREDPAVLRARLAELDRQADDATAIVGRMLAVERGVESATGRQRASQRPSNPARLTAQDDQAALAAIIEADRAYREMDLPQQAERTYELIARAYPSSRWGDLARKRLAEIRGRQSGQIPGKDLTYET